MSSTVGPGGLHRPALRMGTLVGVMSLFVLARALEGGPAPNGTRLVLQIQALKIASDGSSSPTTHRTLPDGHAQLEFLTDGQSVRKTMRGRMLGFPNGSIRLTRAGSERQFALDFPTQTYYVIEALASENAPTGDVHIERTGQYTSILGHKAQRIIVTHRELMTGPGGASVAFTTEIGSWCAQDLRLPKSVADATKMAIMLLSGSTRKEYDDLCPAALRSRMRTSSSPGVELVSSVTAIEKVATSPQMFTVPPGYKQVEPPRR